MCVSSVIVWADDAEPRRARCRPCGREVDATTVGWITALGVRDLEAVKCAHCGSIDLLDTPLESSPTDESVDAYIEAGAGIGTIASGLSRVDPASVVNVLDVGCGYGFALDVGRFLYGWEPLGIEPSRAGERGAEELDLDIRNEYLTADTSLARRFDLIHSSEVIEHVPDPLTFLRVLRRFVTGEGCVVLTTPAAEIVAPGSAESDVLSAVSPGYHVFLASSAGLEALLRAAGFASVEITRRHGTLHAIAAVSPGRAFAPAHAGADIEHALEPYYRFRDKGAPADSALANGMITRYVRAVVSRGDFDAAVAAVPRLIDSMRERHQLDLTDPASTLPALAAGHHVPWHLAGAAFALGMIELLHHRRRERAAAYFELTGAAIAGFEQTAGILDLDSVDLRSQAALHRALALAADDPSTAAALASTLFSDSGSSSDGERHGCRIFVELVGAGQYEAAAGLETEVVAWLRDLSHTIVGDALVVALDALFSLGILALNTTQPATAKEWFQRCLQLAVHGDDAHSVEIADWARSHIAMAVDLGAPAESVVQSWRRPTIHHAVDVYWCDAYGTFIEGWAWAEELPAVDGFTLHVGDAVGNSEVRDTSHLLQYWPDAPACARAGFTAYVEGRPSGRTVLTLHTAAGDHDLELDLPATSLPSPAALAIDDPVEVLARWIAAAPPGPVLALGVRAANDDMAAHRRATFGDREVVGLDIHPGLGVDVVGDAHALSQLFPVGHFAVVYSASLLEHVAVPWLVASECSAVLRPGGLAVHATPWVWPTHGEPNDFWRFSARGLEQLFGPAAGFRVLDSGSCAAAVVVPAPSWRRGAMKMPTTTSPALTWIVSERLAGPSPTVAWAYDPAAGADEARRYPLDGLISEDIDTIARRCGAPATKERA